MTDDVPARNEVLDLPFGEQFLLWAIRHWVVAFADGGNRHAMLKKGFQLARIDEAFPSMDELLTVISTSAKSRIEVRCPDYRGISNDEQLLIGMVAALQRSNVDGYAMILGYWLAPAGVRLAEAPATRLANLMAIGGLWLRRREITRSTCETASMIKQQLLIDRSDSRTLH